MKEKAFMAACRVVYATSLTCLIYGVLGLIKWALK